jgi:cytochrome P450
VTDPGYDPFSAEAMADPLPVYARLRAEPGPYRLARYGAWALSRFADVWEVFTDMEDFSILDGPIFDRATLGRREPSSVPTGPPLPGFVSLDPPLHTALRGAISPDLRPHPVVEMESRIRDLARRRLDELVPAGGFDVRVDYAGPVSAAVICLLVGLSLDHVDAVQNLANASLRRTGGRPGLGADALSARAELDDLLLDLVQRRPDGGGMVDRLSRLEVGDRVLTDEEIVTQIRGVVSGGVETVPKVVAGGLLELWRDPAQRRAVADDPDGCATAFEEMVRFGGPLQWVGRTLLRDRTVAGQPMPAGDRVLLLIASANRDGTEFPDPDRFVWNRRMARHVGFGYGRHHCIGTHVARLEGRVLLEEILARVPGYAIDEDGIEMPPSEFQVGYTRMPLTVG